MTVTIGGLEIPSSTAGSLARYVLGRIPTGGFVRAVLEGDLFEAFARADTINERLLGNIVRVVYCNVPAAAVRGNVDDWLAARGTDEAKRIDAAIRARGSVWEAFLND